MTDNNTALAERKVDAPVMYGDREQMGALVSRMKVMLGTQSAPDEIMYKAAQLCMVHRLVPGEDVHVYKIGGSWVVDDGIEAWKKSADRHCRDMGITYDIITEPLDEEEIKRYRGSEYHKDDRGYRAILLRSDKARMYRDLDREYRGTEGVGFWRKQAYKKGNKTYPDQIPAHRTPDQVAERRAIKTVLKKEFSLHLEERRISDQDVDYLEDQLRQLEAEQTWEEREQRTLKAPTDANLVEDDEGILIWDDDRHVIAETGEIIEDQPEDVPEEVDFYDGDDLEVPDFFDIQEAALWAIDEVGLERKRVEHHYLQIKDELETNEQSALKKFGAAVKKDWQDQRDNT